MHGKFDDKRKTSVVCRDTFIHVYLKAIMKIAYRSLCPNSFHMLHSCCRIHVLLQFYCILCQQYDDISISDYHMNWINNFMLFDEAKWDMINQIKIGIFAVWWFFADFFSNEEHHLLHWYYWLFRWKGLDFFVKNVVDFIEIDHAPFL